MKGWVLRLMTAACVLVGSASAAAEWPVYLGVSYGTSSVDGTANTGDGPVIGSGELPESLPIDGMPFSDDDGTWSAFAGYDINRWAGLEAGYTDLGAFRADTGARIGSETPAISMDSLYLAARLRYPLTNSISASWHLGITETDFDVDGSTQILVIGGGIFGSPVIERIPVPFTEVDDETGYKWGFGVDWRFSRYVSAALEFTRHDVRVVDVDTFNLRLKLHP